MSDSQNNSNTTNSKEFIAKPGVDKSIIESGISQRICVEEGAGCSTTPAPLHMEHNEDDSKSQDADVQQSTLSETNTSAIHIFESVQDVLDLPSTSSQSHTVGTERVVVNIEDDDKVVESIRPTNNPTDDGEEERSCWICFSTDEDNRLAAWVQPCKCRGTTKWVHQSCLYRWVDEKQKGNALRTVNCQQCQTEYIIVFPQMGKVANILEAFDNIIRRVSPFLAAGIFVGSLYWTAVTYGAITFLQVSCRYCGLLFAIKLRQHF